MSAEREVFKELQNLTIEYYKSGRILLRRAIKEFMLEHPEVESLDLTNCTVKLSRHYKRQVPWMGIENEQLSKCVKALGDCLHDHARLVDVDLPIVITQADVATDYWFE